MKTKFEKALFLHKSGNLDEARNLYFEILTAEPKNFEVLHLLGILFAQNKDFSEAKSYIAKALTINVRSAALNNSMGNVLKNLDDYDGAIQYYNKAISINKNYAVAYNNLGNVYAKLNLFDDASSQYKKAINLKPEYADAYYNLALVLIKLNQIEEAIFNLEMTLKLIPKHFEAYCCLGRLLSLKNRTDEAILCLQKALRIDKRSPEAHNNLGAFLIAKDKINHAIRHFKKALILDPVNIEAFNNLGFVFLMQHNLEAALKYFLRLSQICQDPNVFYNLGVIYMDLGRTNDAILYFNNSLNFAPNNFAAHLNLGAIYLRQKDYGNAKKHYEFCLSLNPKNKEIQFVLDAISETKLTSKAPEEYITNLFDQYATIFDKHLSILQYKAPELLFNALISIIDFRDRKLMILDLGCGTGLCGEIFHKYAAKLIGIDLSSKMLALAKEKNIYDELILDNIENSLSFFTNIDFILAADTLVYLGDLNVIFKSAKQAIAKDGFFVFTVEKTNDYPFVLQRSARFAHSSKYITELAGKYNFKVLICDIVVVRNQNNLPVESYLCVLKPL